MYCKEDYWKLVKCSKCYQQLSASDWVRRAGELAYHLACFTCDLCNRQLGTGENFTVVRQSQTECRLLCKLHFLVKNDGMYISTDKIIARLARGGRRQSRYFFLN